ncbi:MAG TPA: hypothetical protein VFK89_12270, partial [Actinomycetota bacterium]|nr:hypothetical protein [Actinomycetota bacterium]
MHKLISVIGAVALLALAGSSNASPVGPGPDGFGSKNVKYVKFVGDEQLHAIGARLVGKYLYVTSVKTITIYDVSDPVNPELMSRTYLGAIWENEDVATNGKILVVADTRPNLLRVFDVEDKTAPTEIATVP